MTTQFASTSYSSSSPGTDPRVYELGTQIAEYASPVKRNIQLILGAILLIIGVGVATYGVTSPLTFRATQRELVIAAGAVIALIALITLETSIRYRQTIVRVFQQGMVCERDGKVETIRWNAIQGLWQNVTKHYRNGIYTGTTHVYTIQTSDGKKMVFNDRIKQVEKLGEQMQDAITALRLPEAYAAYQSGQGVGFGPLTISLNGVSKGNQSVAWNELQGVELVKGFVKFKKQGAWFNFANVRVSEVPNLFVFLSLVDRIVGVNAKKN